MSPLLRRQAGKVTRGSEVFLFLADAPIQSAGARRTPQASQGRRGRDAFHRVRFVAFSLCQYGRDHGRRGSRPYQVGGGNAKRRGVRGVAPLWIAGGRWSEGSELKRMAERLAHSIQSAAARTHSTSFATAEPRVRARALLTSTPFQRRSRRGMERARHARRRCLGKRACYRRV